MKQYLMIFDDYGMQQLKALFRPETAQFLEVQGMGVSTGNVNVLVTPILAPVNPMAPFPVPPSATEQSETLKPDIAPEAV